MVNNYLKGDDRYFFFNDRDQESRCRAWEAATRSVKSPLERLSIWKGYGSAVLDGLKVQAVDPEKLAPIASEVRVIGMPGPKEKRAAGAALAAGS